MEKAHQLATWRELRGNQMGKRLLALWMCFLIAGICIIPVKASAYPILSSWARDEAYLAEANNLYPGGDARRFTMCSLSWTSSVVCGATDGNTARA